MVYIQGTDYAGEYTTSCDFQVSATLMTRKLAANFLERNIRLHFHFSSMGY